MEYTYMDCLAELGVGGAHPGGLPLTKKLLLDEDVQSSTSILDAGCGTGRTSAYLYKQFNCQVTALDHHPIMVKKAQQRFDSNDLPIIIVKGSTEELPFDDVAFDLILSESVIAFTDPLLTVSEFKRILKPDGVLVAIEMVLEKGIPEKELQLLLDFYGLSHLVTVEKWESIFQQAGFENVSIRKFETTFDEHDLDHAPDFLLSEDVDYEVFDILKEHEELTKKYKDVLGYRIFRCTV